MLKKLDKFILKAFFGPLILTMCIVIFVFMMQGAVPYFKYFVGKDLGFDVYLELFGFMALTLVPIGLPLGVLLASLMTYGSLGEHSELVAIKSAGISLVRILIPTGVVAFFLVIFALWYNDNVIPVANLKFWRLLWDIRQTKMTLSFKDGVFYNDLPKYSIRIGHKDPKTKLLNDVMIYDHTASRGNVSLILAQTGTMTLLNANQYLVLQLQNGNRYFDAAATKHYSPEPEFIREKFDSLKVVFDMSSFKMNQTDEGLFLPHNLMKDNQKMRREADSLKNVMALDIQMLAKGTKLNHHYLFRYELSGDTIISKKLNPENKPNYFSNLFKNLDTLKTPERRELYASEIVTDALMKTRQIKQEIANKNINTGYHEKQLLGLDIDVGKRYAQALAIFAMFLIGAPLGAIIKKGGLGVPVLVSIVFFVVYFIITMTTEKYAKQGLISPFMGVWTANLVLFGFGVIFMRQASRDAKLFDTDYYRVIIQNFISKYFRKM
jgi:lipopolysaccharide export system permease protein